MLTGATGFVGQFLLARLLSIPDVSPVAVVRKLPAVRHPRVIYVEVSDIGPTSEWANVRAQTDVVIHAAARVHVLHKRSSDNELAAIRRINVDGTANLARQAAAGGAKRFIFISSIKVNGDSTAPGRPFSADDAPNPSDAYGVSKFEAERKLHQVASHTGMEVVIIRPPLIYGPGVKANFLSLMKWIDRGLPMPFGSINNRRSLVAADNLTDLILTCIDHPLASNQTFLVSDGEDLSTPDLLRRLADALGREARLVNCPKGLVSLAAVLLGRPEIAQRLCGSLQIDMTKTVKMLGFAPSITTQQGLQNTARYYSERVRH